MSRLYFDFKTNLKPSVEGRPIPTIGQFLFQAGENIVCISCAGEEDYGIVIDTYSSRWKGLEYQINDRFYHEVQKWTDQDNTDAFYNLMRNAKPVAIYTCGDDLEEYGYEPQFVPTCEDLDIEIIIGNRRLLFHAESLPEESEWLKNNVFPQRETAEEER